MELGPALLNARAPISGYGRGGFRIGGIEHSGSLLILPGGVYPWPVEDAEGLNEAAFRTVLNEGSTLSFLIFGTGACQIFPAPGLRSIFNNAGLGLEAMDTGAACRTYNILLAEERVFAAALIAIA